MGKKIDRIPSAMEMRLFSLIVQRRPGRDVAKLYNKNWREPISYGTLYTTLRRMAERGWVKVEDDSDEDGRIRWFQISGIGAKAFNYGREYYRELAEMNLQAGMVARQQLEAPHG